MTDDWLTCPNGCTAPINTPYTTDHGQLKVECTDCGEYDYIG